jgi:uncharacterized GH25 family protein
MFKQQWLFRVVFLFLTLAICLKTSSADAHFFSVIPESDNLNWSVGNFYTAVLSYTEIFPSAQVGPSSISGTEIDFSAKFFYTDGEETAFSPFQKSYNNAEDADNGDKPLAEGGGREVYISRARLEKEGTAILAARSYLKMMGMIPVIGYSKQIMNATNDEFSKTAVGAGEVLEIVPLSDLADARVGTPIQFKAILKENPLQDATVEWADSASEVEEGESFATNKNITELAEHTDENGIFTFTPAHPGMNWLAIQAQDGSGMDPFYMSTLIFTAKEQEQEPPGQEPPEQEPVDNGGGCNTGMGTFALLGLGVMTCTALLHKRQK